MKFSTEFPATKQSECRKETVDMVYGFASYEQDECLQITTTRAKMCLTPCFVQQNDSSRKGLWF